MSTIESLNTFNSLASVRVIATTNQTGTYYNGPTNNGVGAQFTFGTGVLIFEGVTLLLNDYILFAGQTLGYQNGIYQVVVLGTAGTSAVVQRRGDFQCMEQIKTGQFITVEAGSSNAGSIAVVVEPLPSAIGVPNVSGANNINFIVQSSGVGGGSLLSSNNLSDVISPTVALFNLGGLPKVGGALYPSGPTGYPIVISNTVASFTSLATAGSVVILPSSGSHRYQILNVMLNRGGTNFSGGGGDRNGSVSDGTNVYSVIPAASMQSLVNSSWGATATPYPASAAISQLSVAGQPVSFLYSGGTTDYTAGSLTITVIAALVA